jgi:alpha/beta hydrolase family protein
MIDKRPAFIARCKNATDVVMYWRQLMFATESRKQLYVISSLMLLVFPFVMVLPVRSATMMMPVSPQVMIVSAQPVGSGYLEVQAVMSGMVVRGDQSQGTYKVPISLLYPQDTSICNGSALVDVINSVFYETYDSAGTRNDPFFPSLFPIGRLTLGDAFIQGHGYVYAQAQWNKLVIERQRLAGTLSDPTLHIDAGADGYAILRDLSAFLRSPANSMNGSESLPCAAENVIAFGYSQTGMLLRQFYFAGLNTKLVNSSVFDEGLVFEGSLQATPGSRCRNLTDQAPWYLYSYNDCTGSTPKSQGKVITYNTESDIQVINGWRARSADSSAQKYYRLYELAGTSHIPTTLFPLKPVGIRPAEMAEQNYVDTGPVLRAMVEHLRAWIEGSGEPPVNEYLQGKVDRLATPLFTEQSWGNDNQQVYLFRLGLDGNALGGIRLPHLRTVLTDGNVIGGPLGIYRGVECNNDPTQSSFILECQLSGDANIYNIVGGTFIPYTETTLGQCAVFYDSYATYLNEVAEAVAYAVAQRWILPEETDSIIASATQKSHDFPGCVSND